MPPMARRVVAVIADPISGSEAIEQLRSAAGGEEVDLRLVAAPVEANPLRHTLGDIDGPRREASERLEASLESLRDAGLEARGEVGDPDPIQAAQDALLEAPAARLTRCEWLPEPRRRCRGGAARNG
jgi:hypothetical protein